VVHNSLKLALAFAGACVSTVIAQSPNDLPLLSARRLSPTFAISLWNAAGHVRVTAWDLDSLVIRGRVDPSQKFMFGAGENGVKSAIEGRVVGADPKPSDLAVWVPRRAKVTVRTESADIDGVDVTGNFYTVSGAIRISGTATSVEAESMKGNLDLNVNVPWLRAKTGEGHLLLRGRPQDVDASTITGTLDIATATVLRGQFTSVSGDIHYAAAPPSGAILEFSNHGGGVDLLLPSNASGVFALSSVSGAIENSLPGVRPAAVPRAMRVTLGRGDASITVRTFKGAIRLRPQ